ncbi:MAG: valyl-tRNA synthetase [Candidatus Krumholzibacteriota bacterium]|nr:valyl-tRNA synthetase [Candidatus Krumholzibacteriota bacterium]
MALDRLFDFGKAQDRWNAEWEKTGAFTPEASSSKEPFVIILPPPNVTGILHVGHVLGDSVQDLLVRWRRMQGYNALYVPGVDHAGIATQKVVESQIEAAGVKRKDLTREEFLRHAWAWKEKHHKHIVAQLKKLGCSLDWTREAFTLDEKRSRAVREVFVRLYEKGLIYRGDYIVNWCPSCGTAISDEEVQYKEKDAHLYWIKYPIRDGGFIVVATTRPETMLGDTAVAVSPEDPKKKPFVGKTVILPVVGRELPIIADPVVDPEFGSGFVKVTPAHDPNDFEMGRRHNLAQVVVIDREGKMTEAAGAAFAGLERGECRKRLLEILASEGLVEKIEPYRHSVGEHDRCGTVIEPLVSREWFVRMQPLAVPAIAAVETGEIEFYPPRWRNVYLSWMNNIRDWCISRQLWWGHRIPVWCCPDGHMTVSREDPSACVSCGSRELVRDENVLDTWFSSWLWTFSPLGWPEKTKDLEMFHPTSVLVTGSEIIFFWVARMIMASLEFMGEIPFRQVFLTGIVRDMTGRKMSKSLGNSPDPLDIIDRYGTDAFRFTLVMLSPPGRDVYFTAEKLEMGRNFVNKLWQASRLVLGSYEKSGGSLASGPGAGPDAAARAGSTLSSAGHSGEAALVDAWRDLYEENLGFVPEFEWEDRWILSALDRCIGDVNEGLGGWRVNDAASRAYDFFWSEFCDWYLELSKIRLYGDGDKRTVLAVLLYALGESIRMLHPFLPYVTEELWSALPMSKGMVLKAGYPLRHDAFADAEAEKRMELFKGLATSARNIRALYRVNPSAKIELRVKTPDDDLSLLDAMSKGLEQLVRADRVVYGPSVAKEKGCASSPVGGYEVIVPLSGVADLEAEIKRLRKEKGDLEKDLAVVHAKLSNEDFLAKAKEDVVQRTREKRETLATELAKIDDSLKIIGENR